MSSTAARDFIVMRQVKNLFKAKGLRTSQEAIDALSGEMEKLCLAAADKAIASKMKTVKKAHIVRLDAFLGPSDSAEGA